MRAMCQSGDDLQGTGCGGPRLRFSTAWTLTIFAWGSWYCA